MRIKTWLHLVSGFAVFNTAIGVTLFFYYPKVPFSVISPLIPQAVWAGIFLATGLVMSFAVLKKKYRLLWHMMIVGLFIKTMWEIGLLLRIPNGGTLFTAEIWGLIFYIQFWGVTHFDRRILT